jgi:hypothetical protein
MHLKRETYPKMRHLVEIDLRTVGDYYVDRVQVYN